MATKMIDFYIIDGAQQNWSPCKGYPLTIDSVPFKFAVHKQFNYWTVTNLETGGSIATYRKTRKDAEAIARERIAKVGVDQFTRILNATVARNGVAPNGEKG